MISEASEALRFRLSGPRYCVRFYTPLLFRSAKDIPETIIALKSHRLGTHSRAPIALGACRYRLFSFLKVMSLALSTLSVHAYIGFGNAYNLKRRSLLEFLKSITE